MKMLIFWMIIMSCLPACSGDDRQIEKVNEKQMQLDSLQREIVLKDQELAIKEKTIDSLTKISQADSSRDSVLNDTSHTVHFMNGLWNVSLTCTKSTCENFAVGDVKSEVWKITDEQSLVLAEVVSANLHKSYSGAAGSNTINLKNYNQPQDSTSSSNEEIRLKINAQNKVEGEKELIRKNCRVVYSLTMEKQ